MFTNLRLIYMAGFSFFPAGKGENNLVAQKVHFYFNEAIKFVVNNKEKYVKNPRADFSRIRKLSLDDMLKQILSMEGGSLQKELYSFGQIYRRDVTSSAFIQQRSKISGDAFKDIFSYFNDWCNDKKKLKGYRVLAADGSDVNHYRNPNHESFVSHSGCKRGYNQTHLNAIFDILNKTYFEVSLQPKPKENEVGALIEMLQRIQFKGKNLIITDRGYVGYNLIAHFINTKNVDFLMRVKQGKGALREIKKLPMMELDKDLSFEVTTTQTKEDKLLNRIYIQTQKNTKSYSKNTNRRNWDFHSPYLFKFRVVRFMLETGEYETVITSLPREKFCISDIKELYHMRWGIETSFRELKYAIGLINLHSKKEEFVEQEIYAALTMYNYCSRMASEAVVQNCKNTVYEYKVNFKMAVYLCKTFYRLNKNNFDQLLKDIEKHAEPVRPGRKDKRNVKFKTFVGFTYRVAA